MRLWPFGSDDDDASGVDTVSRVVSGRARDGAVVRAKLTLHFEAPVPQAEADEQADAYAARLKQRFDETDAGSTLIGAEATLSSELGGPRASATAAIRSVEVVAVHLVGAGSMPPPSRRRSTPPPSMALGRRSNSSSQMLAVRGDILVRPGSTAEQAGRALAPLLRDVKTRVLIGILRNYDLLALRRVEPDDEMLDAMVPQSTAALGRFAESRADELDKWDAALGDDVMLALRKQAAAVTALHFQRALSNQSVDPDVAAEVLEHAANQAFVTGMPTDQMRSYAGLDEEALAVAVTGQLSERLRELEDQAGFARAMLPLLAALDADFVFAASQVKIGVIV
jgi:hypothetical protein